MTAIRDPLLHCFLGSDELSGNVHGSEPGKGWQKRNWTLSHPVINARADRDYLFPITREMNPNFKGVIHVNGDVAISGTVRRVTIAASGDIIIAATCAMRSTPGPAPARTSWACLRGDIVVTATVYRARQRERYLPYARRYPRRVRPRVRPDLNEFFAGV